MASHRDVCFKEIFVRIQCPITAHISGPCLDFHESFSTSASSRWTNCRADELDWPLCEHASALPECMSTPFHRHATENVRSQKLSIHGNKCVYCATLRKCTRDQRSSFKSFTSISFIASVSYMYIMVSDATINLKTQSKICLWSWIGLFGVLHFSVCVCLSVKSERRGFWGPPDI